MNNVRQLLEMLYRQSEQHLPLVLATVVQVSGSAYHSPGARMLITQKSERCGMISGGCIERDVALRGWALTNEGPRVVAYDTRGRLEKPAGDFGAGCDGIVYVLLERIECHHNWFSQTLESILADRNAKRIATIYRVSNSEAVLGELRVGQRFFYASSKATDESQIASDKCTESLTHAVQSCLDRVDWPSDTLSLQLQHQSLGSIDLLLETLQPSPRLVVFGAGDDAIPLVSLAQAIGWDTLVCDKRASLLDRARFPASRFSSLPLSSEMVCRHPQHALQQNTLKLSTADAVVLMTHDLQDDAILLGQLVKHPVSYIGLLGPKRRTAKLVSELYRRGQLPDEVQLRKLRTPVGLDIGAEGPEEIAVSIVAEIIANRNFRDGRPLHERGRSIHNRLPTKIAKFELQENIFEVFSQ